MRRLARSGNARVARFALGSARAQPVQTGEGWDDGVEARTPPDAPCVGRGVTAGWVHPPSKSYAATPTKTPRFGVCHYPKRPRALDASHPARAGTACRIHAMRSLGDVDGRCRKHAKRERGPLWLCHGGVPGGTTATAC